ncbi:class I SAM-dependent methyltransferase [soil metagenome]
MLKHGLPSPTDYDDIAERYADGVDSRTWNALYERPNTLALLPDVKDRDVLDAGCGNGWYADWLATRGARVIAVDRSERMVDIARNRLGDRARVFASDLSDLSLEPASLDLVVSSLVLHYIPNLYRAFSAIARALRPGGTFVFSTYHPATPGSKLSLETRLVEEHWKWIGTMRFYERPLSGLTEPLADAGFVIERMREPLPSEEVRQRDPTAYKRLSANPAFLFVRARKDE